MHYDRPSSDFKTVDRIYEVAGCRQVVRRLTIINFVTWCLWFAFFVLWIACQAGIYDDRASMSFELMMELIPVSVIVMSVLLVSMIVCTSIVVSYVDDEKVSLDWSIVNTVPLVVIVFFSFFMYLASAVAPIP